MQRQQLNSMYWKNEMMNYDEQLYVKNVRKQRGISTIESREPLSTGLHWIEIISNWDGSEFFRKYPTSYLSCIFPSNAIVFHRIHLSTRSSCVRTQELLNTNETETPIDITWSCFDRPIWFFTILLGFCVCVKFALIFFCFEFFLFRIILLVKLIYCLAISTKLSNSWISFQSRLFTSEHSMSSFVRGTRCPDPILEFLECCSLSVLVWISTMFTPKVTQPQNIPSNQNVSYFYVW